MDVALPLSDLSGSATARILQHLSHVRSPLSGRAIGLLAGVPARTADRTLGALTDAGILTREPAGRGALYTVNRDHVLWPAIESALASRAEVERRIRATAATATANDGTAALYGSFVRGTGRPDSDIDLLVIWDGSATTEERDRTRDELHRVVHTSTGNDLDLLELDDADLARLVRDDDALIDSLRRDARTLLGVDIRKRIESAV